MNDTVSFTRSAPATQRPMTQDARPLAATGVGVAVTRRPRLHLFRRVVALAVPVLMLLGFAVVSAAPASAVTWRNSGYNGVAYTYPTAVGQYVTKTRNGWTSTLPGVRVPGMVLGRSAATTGAQSNSQDLWMG